MTHKLFTRIKRLYNKYTYERIVNSMTKEEKSELALSIYQNYIDLITKVDKTAMSKERLAYLECNCYYSNTAYLRLTEVSLDDASAAIKDAWGQFSKKPDWIELDRILTREFKKIADLDRAIKYLR